MVRTGLQVHSGEPELAPGPGWLWLCASVPLSLANACSTNLFYCDFYPPHFLQIFTALIPN